MLAQSVPVGANIDTMASLLNLAISAPACALLVTAFAYFQNYLSHLWYIVYIALFALRFSAKLLASLQQPSKVDWSKQVVVLTGGAHGIGLCLLHKLTAAGAQVAVIDILDAPKQLSENVSFYKCDLSDSQQLDATLDQIEAKLGAPTMLINNAGTVCPRLVHEHSAADVERVLGVNLIAPVQITRRLLPGMIKAPSAHIIFIASALSFIGVPQLSTYTASKAGLALFYESLKLELRHRLQAAHVKTTAFFPSKVQSGMFNGLLLPKWLSPELPTSVVADRIFAALESSESGEVYMPVFASLSPLYMFFPQLARDLINWLSNSIDTMRYFTGYTV
ncbi:hypothetical protein IWW36_001518 [Coemansia brasiliensis]|uniref:NAD(P)-binding protein n=1 Tax=Coemansia brasiliensis TaxID=2650707 RepID=A0A9W8M1W9_9FUNG|nr:hypothetical protein IWW36_001518 [Coemansia brasiliensis]